MKIISTKNIRKIQSKKSLSWEEGKSFIFHEKNTPVYYCISRFYVKLWSLKHFDNGIWRNRPKK